MSWLEKALPVAINTRLINKNEKNDQLAFVEGWENLDATVEQLAGAVAYGYAFCAQMSQGRKKSNFRACGFAAVDVDGGRRLDDIDAVDIIRTSATMIYTTVSHSEDEHRFRVVFALEQPVTDADEYRALLRSLTLRIGGDRAATDPARIFYGNSNSEPTLADKGLSNEKIQELIDQSFNALDQRSEGAAADRRTSVALTRLQPGQLVILKDGSSHAYDALDVRTPVLCPFHHDTKPSGFVIESQRHIKGIHCSACASSFWPEHDEEYDFGSFETAVKAVKARLEGDSAHEDEFIDHILPYVQQPNSITIADERYVESLVVGLGLTFVKSPKGSGKTQFLKTITNTKGKTILLVGHRRSLIGQMCDTLDIDCYLNDSAGVRSNKKRYGISLDSVCSVPSQSEYDYILIDESEQVLSHFLSDTLSAKRNRIFHQLKQLIKNARHVIALDADCGWLTFKSICQWAMEGDQKKAISIYINEHKRQLPPVQIYNDRNTIVGDIIKSLDNRQKM